MLRVTRLFLLLFVVSGCREGEGGTAGQAVAELPPGHVPIDGRASSGLTSAAQAAIDSGNAAFRTRSFDVALRWYERAAREVPRHPAPWFGAYMVGQATNNAALSDSALRMVRERSPSVPAHPGAAPAAPHSQGTPPYSPHAAPRSRSGAPT